MSFNNACRIHWFLESDVPQIPQETQRLVLN